MNLLIACRKFSNEIPGKFHLQQWFPIILGLSKDFSCWSWKTSIVNRMRFFTTKRGILRGFEFLKFCSNKHCGSLKKIFNEFYRFCTLHFLNSSCINLANLQYISLKKTPVSTHLYPPPPDALDFALLIIRKSPTVNQITVFLKLS